MLIPPVIRSNVDYVCVLQDSVLANRKRLYEFFFGMFDTFNQFDGVFKQVTAENGCLILDKTQTSLKVNDSVFYYKAQLDIPGFKIGKRFYFQMDKKLQTSQDSNDTPTAQIVSVPKK
jgi:hypothetical protein